MEFEKDNYQTAFSHLKASPQLREELLAMTEQNTATRRTKKFILRRLAVAAAVMALAAALAMGANAASNGEFFGAVGELVFSFKTEDGTKVSLHQGKTESGDDVYFAIAEEDGAQGGEALESGQYLEHYTQVEVDENGEIEFTENGTTTRSIPAKEPARASSQPEQ